MRRASALLLLVAAPIVFGGCHDEERLRQRLEGPAARLPVEPDQPKSPPAPALLDTVRAWQPPVPYRGNAMNAWDIVKISVDSKHDLTYRIPQTWRSLGNGKSTSMRGEVNAHARMTNLVDTDISLATYAAQLAEGNPIYQYVTADGHVVYLTQREVALAPSDPDAPREVFHTSVVSIDGRIAKLDVRYDSELDWRFNERASAISGTLQVRPRPE